jgi:SAM-dependent methyltransferase
MSLLPLLYNIHHSLQSNDLPFWEALARNRGEPVLELGCGTGRVLLKLAEDGYRVFGLDNDMQMLVYLQSRIRAGLRVSPAVFLADMTAFHLDRQFPLILMPCNTLSTHSRSGRLSTLKLVQKHLSTGGLFAASLPNPTALAELDPSGESEVEDVFLLPNTGTPVQVSSRWEKEGDQFLLQWIYDLLEPDGRIQRFQIQTVHSLDPVSFYLSDFSKAGLTVIELLGGTDNSPYEEGSDELLILAENRS